MTPTTHTTGPDSKEDICSACQGKGQFSRCYDERGADDFGGEGYTRRGLIEHKPCRRCNGTGKKAASHTAPPTPESPADVQKLGDELDYISEAMKDAGYFNLAERLERVKTGVATLEREHRAMRDGIEALMQEGYGLDAGYRKPESPAIPGKPPKRALVMFWRHSARLGEVLSSLTLKP